MHAMLLSDEDGRSRDAAGRFWHSLRTYLPSWWVLILVPVAIFGTIALHHMALGTGGRVPRLYPPTAIMLVALLRNRPATWPALLFSGTAVEAVAHWQFGFDIAILAINCLYNLLEVLLIAVSVRRFGDLRSWYLSMRWTVVCTLCSLVAASIAVSTAFALIYAVDHPYTQYTTQFRWFKQTISDTASVVLILPLLLSWTEPAFRQSARSWTVLEAAWLMGIVAALTCAAFLMSGSVAALFLMFPLLSLVTLRGGLAGTTGGAIVATAVAILLTILGWGPIATYPNLTFGDRISFMQLYFLGAMLSSIPMTMILKVRTTLIEAVDAQAAISQAALSNMAQGLSMFDARDRLIICNGQYSKLYGLPDKLTEPMTPLDEVVAHHCEGGRPMAKLKRLIRRLRDASEQDQSSGEITLPDGRVINVHCRRLPDGGWVATHEDITERRKAEERITYLANFDALTGLSNRAQFNEQLNRLVSYLDRGHRFALHAVDLDRFKEVNDTFGHAAGDELLRQVAGRLRDAVRTGEVVTRLGGDEFAILQFPLERPEEASALAARIVKLLAKPFTIDGRTVEIGASVGIALAPTDTCDAAELMQKSDLALYRAKMDGRNTYRFYQRGMDVAQHARRALEADLRSAIRNGEFELYYQPIMDVKEGRIASCEALLRWRHPTRGLVDPAEFISVAEETGLILPIGQWALTEACRQAASWPGEVKVAVNLSPVQFKNPRLVSQAKGALARAGLDASRLELEITESVLLQNNKSVLRSLHRLRDMGVSIAMDDFGTGYSSLSYLRSFPFDKIKIDRSFVSGLGSRADNLAIVHSAIGLSRSLGMICTGEGVERREEYALLEAEGCTQVQGYYISRPVPADRLQHLLRDGPSMQGQSLKHAA
jgi:diguanylate cyclase (GGDEF)-like protein